MDSANKRWLILLLFILVGCGGMMDDLAPSGSDKRPLVQCGITGPSVCQYAPDFTLFDTQGNSVTLLSEITTTNRSGIVIYFTMWCPYCDSDMTEIRDRFIPSYPNVRFYAVDYVSGSVAAAANAELANGYSGSGFGVLADTQHAVQNLYQATMQTTIVIDKTGVILMNEGYKDGKRLQTALAALP